MKKVTKYQTADGKIFDTNQQAERHEKDLILNKVDSFIKSWFDTCHAKSNYNAIILIEKDLTLFKAQIEEILYIMKHCELDEDEE